MYCTKCGNLFNSGDKFCSKCGELVKKMYVEPDNIIKESQKIPNFGVPILKWWGACSSNQSFSGTYNWLSQRSTLIIFENHFVFVKESEKNSKKLYEYGVLFGAVGTVAAITLGIGSIIKNKMNSSANGINADIAKKMYELGDFVWCNKSDAEVWEVRKKSFLGVQKQPLSSLMCKLNTLSGNLHILFPLVESQDTLLSDPKTKLGCKTIIKAEGLSGDEALTLYKNLHRKLPAG